MKKERLQSWKHKNKKTESVKGAGILWGTEKKEKEWAEESIQTFLRSQKIRRRGGWYRSALQEAYNYSGLGAPEWWTTYNPKYVEIPPRKELTNSDFGKEREPYVPVKGNVVGECIELRNEEWQNGMSYDHFIKYILKVDLTRPPEDLTYLIEIIKKINNK